MEVRISVLLPVFNAESTLKVCLDSLFSQTFQDFEIIAVDDGSTDGSPDILFDFGKRDKRLRLVTCEHAGIVSALKTAFSHSRANYIARMDADDICLPPRFARQAAFLDKRGDVAVVGTQVGPVPGEVFSGGYTEYLRWMNNLIEPEQIAVNIFVESPLSHPTVMFRRRPYTGDRRTRG